MHRPARYLLPLFALLWLAAIYASVFLDRSYVIDAVLRPAGSDVSVVSAGPAAQQAGLLPGSIVLLSAMPLGEAARIKYGVPFGTPLHVAIRTGSATRTITLPATKNRNYSTPLKDAFDLLTITVSLLLAAYLGARKPGMMMAALILFLGGGDLSWPRFASIFAGAPDFIYLPLVVILSALCDWFPVLALASFAVRLPGGEPGAKQRAAIRVVDAIVLAGFVIALFPAGNNVYVLATALCAIVLLAASIAALSYAHPHDRARVGIVFAGVVVGGVGYANNMIGLRAFGEPPFLFTSYATLSVIIVPVSVAYAILRHRVFDIAFVLNRTIVYGLTSAVVVFLFAALEFGAERFLSDLTHVESVLLQFGIALFVAVNVRVVHARTDRLVDNVLFRSRHEQESALRRFAVTLQFYTEDRALIRDTVDALSRFARVQGAALYLASPRGLELALSSFSLATPEVDENDTAYVELRAHHEALQVHGTPTAFPGDRLYPMILAGRIGGVIATGERESGEVMPPDIDDAIKRIAEAAAIALAAIDTDRIRQENAVLHARLGLT